MKGLSLGIMVAMSGLAMPLTGFASSDDLPAIAGTFNYQIKGDFNGPLGAGKVTETGVFQADGKGRITARAIANISSADLSTELFSGQSTYSCTYQSAGTPKISGLILVKCTRKQSGLPDQNVDFILTSPSLLGKLPTIQIQAQSGGSWGVLQVSGEAQRAALVNR